MATFVLIHGAWHYGALWEGVAEPLRDAGHAVHTPTLAGNGPGEDIDRTVGHADAVASAVDYVVGRDLTDFVLLGHSYGGTISLVLAFEWPELVGRLTLLEPAPYPLLREAGETVFADEIERRNGDFIATVRGGGLNHEAMESYLDYFNARPGYWRSLDRETRARMLTLSDRLAVGLEAVGRLETSREDLAAVAVPATVVRGGATDPLHARLSELVASAIPGASLVDLPGAGHMMTLTHGAEIAEILRISAGAAP